MRNFFLLVIFVVILYYIYDARKNPSLTQNVNIHKSEEISANNDKINNQKKLNLSDEKDGQNNSVKIEDKAAEDDLTLTNDESSSVNFSIDEKEPSVNSSIDEKVSSENEVKVSIFDFKTIYEDDLVLGDPKSPIILVEYFSLTCPMCKYFYEKEFPMIKQKYIDTNKIAYVKRELVAYKQDFEAATLARCNGDLESRMKFYETLLKNQDNWALKKNFHDILVNIGQVGNIPAEKFATCLSDKNIANIFLRNLKDATSNPKFTGTPFVFINGEPFLQGLSSKNLSKIIDEEIAKLSN